MSQFLFDQNGERLETDLSRLLVWPGTQDITTTTTTTITVKAELINMTRTWDKEKT